MCDRAMAASGSMLIHRGFHSQSIQGPDKMRLPEPCRCSALPHCQFLQPYCHICNFRTQLANLLGPHQEFEKCLDSSRALYYAALDCGPVPTANRSLFQNKSLASMRSYEKIAREKKVAWDGRVGTGHPEPWAICSYARCPTGPKQMWTAILSSHQACC